MATEPEPTAWKALTARRLRLLVSRWPWQCLGYLLSSPIVVLGWMMLCFPLGPLAGIPLAAVERRRLGWVTASPAPSPHTAAPHPGLAGQLRWWLREPATWQELLYGVLLIPLGVVDAFTAFFLLAVPIAVMLAPLTDNRASGDQVQVLVKLGLDSGHPLGAVAAVALGLLMLALGLYLITAVATGRVYVAGLLLVGDREAQLGRRVRDLLASRNRVVSGIEAERRRIERDLHDGTQQRLTSLLMTLGMLRMQLADPQSPARGLVDRAHEEASQALRELRDFVHGIYPATLRERGLQAMLAEISDQYPMPVDLRVELARRPSSGVEYTLYFAVCEALSNVSKHSRATSVVVDVRQAGGRYAVRVEDNGVGGADAAGAGLAGIADRVEAYGGTVRVSSPPGGPTIVAMEVPCES